MPTKDLCLRVSIFVQDRYDFGRRDVLCASIALAETPVNDMPVGSIKPFWLPPTATSTPHSSMRKSSEPSEEIVSLNNKAGCFVASSAARTSFSGNSMPVAVSLCTAQIALMRWSLSAASVARSAAKSTPRCQSALITSAFKDKSSAICAQLCEKWPVSMMATVSPGENRLTRLASQAA